MTWKSYPADETINGTSTLFNFLRNCQTFLYSLTYNPLIPRYLPKGNVSICPHKDLNKNIHSSSFVRAPNCKKLKCPWIGEHNMCYIHKVEYDSAIKRNELLIYITTWMQLKIIVLNERSQTPSPQIKNLFCMIPLYKTLTNIKRIYSGRKQIRSCMDIG